MKHTLRLVMVILLSHGIVYPMPSLNIGKELIQKGTGWVARTVPWWVPWLGAVFFCGALWQRDHNRWEASEKEKEELKEKNEGLKKAIKEYREQSDTYRQNSVNRAEQEVKNDAVLLAQTKEESRNQEIYSLLSASNVGGVVFLNPKCPVIIRDSIAFFPNELELRLLLKNCPENLKVNVQDNDSTSKVLLIKEKLLTVYESFLSLIGTNSAVKIWDEENKITLDNTVRKKGLLSDSNTN